MTLKQFNLKKKLRKMIKGDSRASAVFQMAYYDVIIMLKFFEESTDKQILDMVESFDAFQMVSRGLYEGVIRALEVYTVAEILEIFDLIQDYHKNPNY